MTLPTIGFLVGTTYDAWQDYIKAFEDRLANGYNWNKNSDYTVEYQPAAGLADLYKTIAKDFASRKPPLNVIVTGGTGPTYACLLATGTIPIVFATAADGKWLVNQSKGNVTGISNEQTAHVPHRLKHMTDHMPALLGGAAFKTIGIIGNENVKNVQQEIAAITTLAPAAPFNLTLKTSGTVLNSVDDIPTIIQDLQGQGAQGLYVCTDPLITTNADILNEYAATMNLPTMHAFRQNRGQRGSLSWGPKLEVLFSRAADFAYAILTSTTTPPTIPTWEIADPNKFEHHP
jgi:putative ABC transport system substrate-binding protein